MATTPRLNDDSDLIERLELDLVGKVQTAFTAAQLATNIHGVFSIDDLEKKTEADLCSKIAVGVGYMGAEQTKQTVGSEKHPLAVGSANAARSIDFLFHIILGVPTGEQCIERYNATKLLTVIRRGVLGSIVSGDATNRRWVFVQEFPNVSESTETMLYYSQVWRLAIIEKGPIPQI